MKQFLQTLGFVVAFVLPTIPSIAQELSCKVTVTARKIQEVDPKVFKALEKALNDFMNSRKWTTDVYQPNEKIECTFLLNVSERVEENVYKASLNINASRPVFGTNYNTPIFNFIEKDDNFIFRFEESQTLIFDDNRVSGSDPLSSNLPAMFAYYAYLILGFDYDSFSLLGGTPYFKKAQNIVINAPEDGKKIPGWKSDEGNKNRYWMIDQIMHPRYESFRPMWYAYHRNGLDQMTSNADSSAMSIMELLPIIDKLNKDNPNSVLLQLFFFNKSVEYLNLLGQLPADKRKTYVDILTRVDIPNSAKYRGVK